MYECHVISFQENLNLVCDTSVYSIHTQHAMAQMNEKDFSFDLIEVFSTPLSGHLYQDSFVSGHLYQDTYE